MVIIRTFTHPSSIEQKRTEKSLVAFLQPIVRFFTTVTFELMAKFNLSSSAIDLSIAVHKAGSTAIVAATQHLYHHNPHFSYDSGTFEASNAV